MDMPSQDVLVSKLKQVGMRITPQRIAICKQLLESDAHPTAAMIYENVRAHYPSLSLMTVYNTLHALGNLGAINVLGHAGDDNTHYDADTEPHANLACVSCHKIRDIHSENVNRLNIEIGMVSNYKLLGARVMYYGICPDCQGESKTK